MTFELIGIYQGIAYIAWIDKDTIWIAEDRL